MSIEGDDSNNGLSNVQAVQSIQKGIDLADSNGDIVHIAEGEYKGSGNVNVQLRGIEIHLMGKHVDQVVINCEGNRGFVIDHGNIELCCGIYFM